MPGSFPARPHTGTRMGRDGEKLRRGTVGFKEETEANDVAPAAVQENVGQSDDDLLSHIARTTVQQRRSMNLLGQLQAQYMNYNFEQPNLVTELRQMNSAMQRIACTQDQLTAMLNELRSSLPPPPFALSDAPEKPAVLSLADTVMGVPLTSPPPGYLETVELSRDQEEEDDREDAYSSDSTVRGTPMLSVSPNAGDDLGHLTRMVECLILEAQVAIEEPTPTIDADAEDSSDDESEHPDEPEFNLTSSTALETLDELTPSSLHHPPHPPRRGDLTRPSATVRTATATAASAT
ncbi:hypothetical protein HK101_011002, partial [Irineochytrium annulatum]